jgi:hypothetical protein
MHLRKNYLKIRTRMSTYRFRSFFGGRWGALLIIGGRQRSFDSDISFDLHNNCTAANTVLLLDPFNRDFLPGTEL